MNKLPLFSEIAISGARLLKESYPEPISPYGLYEIVIFFLYITANEYRLRNGSEAYDNESKKSLDLLVSDMSVHTPLPKIDCFINDRMQIYQKEYQNIARNHSNPAAWDVVYYLFYKNPLGPYPTPYDLLHSNLFELYLFETIMLQVIHFLKDSINGIN